MTKYHTFPRKSVCHSHSIELFKDVFFKAPEDHQGFFIISKNVLVENHLLTLELLLLMIPWNQTGTVAVTSSWPTYVCLKIEVPPVIIHVERWDFPWNKPSSELGVPIYGKPHIYVCLKIEYPEYLIVFPCGWLARRVTFLMVKIPMFPSQRPYVWMVKSSWNRIVTAKIQFCWCLNMLKHFWTYLNISKHPQTSLHMPKHA